MRIQDMAQNSFIQEAISCEAIKSWANAHHQNSLFSNGITPKLPRPFKSYVKNISLYKAYFLKLKFPLAKTFLSSSSAPSLSYSAHPFISLLDDMWQLN